MNNRLSRGAANIGLRTISLLVIMWAATVGKAQIFPAGDALPFELYTIDANGGNPHKLVNTSGYTCGSPEWSSDGKRIAFDMWQIEPYTATLDYNPKSQHDSQIAVIYADGTHLQLIGPGGMPSFSPDGTHLVCHTYDKPQSVVVMTTDGRGREPIKNNRHSPRWSLCGNYIASLSKDKQILIFDLATGRESGILPPAMGGPYYFSQPGFGIAPNGCRMVFGDSDGLFLVTLKPNKSFANIRWPIKGGLVRHCSWSPDGKRVAIGWTKSAGAPEQIFTLDIDSTSPPIWLPGQDPKRANACPDWSPDGKTTVFVSQAPAEQFETKIPQLGTTKP